MDDLILKQISNLISTHSGIQIRTQDYKTLAGKIWQRAQARGLTSLQGYYQVLLKELELPAGSRSDANYSASGEPLGSEWQELYAILTINESYFFRDKNQYRLLADSILPGIIHRNRLAHEANATGERAFSKPRLRIWSAGCSTGEELYSIAMVLEELRFPWDQWDVLLVGTDISKTAIASAQKGLYGNWSFRQVPPQIQQKYFVQHHQLYKVCDSLRERVTFLPGNLLRDNFPSQINQLYNLDLILCRNVFIYLDEHAIQHIIHKFQGALVPQGYLMTGHTELYGQDISEFQVLSFPESILYQRRLTPSFSAPAPPVVPPSPPPRRERTTPVRVPRARPTRASQPPVLGPTWASPPPSVDLTQALAEAETLLKQQAYNRAIARAEKIYTTYPQCDAAFKIAAHAYANIGGYDQAKYLCQQVLQRQPLSVDMYYLLAQIAEDQNELDITKDYLRKIIYLDSSFVKAYLDLATIYEREKQLDKTKKMHSHALDILAKLPPDSVLDSHSGTTVAQWKEHLEKKAMV
jgi:chemotaxis protein methyltransferase CheR